jgi:hypothetical protein
MSSDLANAALDYVVSERDRLSFKYYYQTDPVSKPYAFAQTGGFPVTQENGSQVGALDNTISIGSRLNWEQRVGYARMYSYSYFNQTVTPIRHLDRPSASALPPRTAMPATTLSLSLPDSPLMNSQPTHRPRRRSRLVQTAPLLTPAIFRTASTRRPM